MRPDLKRFFQGLREDAASLEAQRIERQLEADRLRVQREALKAQREMKEAQRLAEIQTRKDQAARFMAESEFPAILQELKVLYLAVGERRGFEIVEDEEPSYEVGNQSLSVPWNHALPKDKFIYVLMGSSVITRVSYETGFAIFMSPEGEVSLQGEEIETFTHDQWRGAIEVQASAVERAFDKPFHVYRQIDNSPPARIVEDHSIPTNR